ncbi:hypothetical protein C2857_006957 [Epichloe festucae Fl1]|uniref:tRNA wybutosine-synthesizing protein 2 n=1 Tax=Epichloe festucae (strain Fl1) TaxID=877507 RepID=A0A7S9KQD3_EPIFF|nr:hypothetical protein C2857_006957 [Epichloe festucae Fl1]
MADKPHQPHQPHSDPIQTAISKWTSTISPPTDDAAAASAWAQELSSNAPKRFTIYEPMALLPAGSFGNPPWTTELARHSAAVTDSLWTTLLQELSRSEGRSKSRLTHLAANEGIPLLRDQGGGGGGGCDRREEENVMRSPSGLRMLHGDFGPPEPDCPPSRNDFANAFWVSTKQNGILQTWAPRWTMFSRGNVKEKARLLGFPRAPPGSEEEEEGGGRSHVWAVDLYAGIGYFAFCYAKLGMRVLCWELNPWSVEALRRGARLNKWSVDVFSRPGTSVPSEDMMASTARIVLLAEDNGIARWRTEDMKKRRRGGPWLRDVRHVNCGLLPTSRLTWDCALSLTRTTTTAGQPAWLHLHENVGEADVEPRRREIELLLGGDPGEEGLNRCIRVDRVEKVKTYAPGVWHCVFDVLVTRRE